MAGPSTLLLPVRRAVIAGVAALPELADVTCMTVYKSTTDRSILYTRRGRFHHESHGMRSGRNPRHERGLFDLVLFVQVPGGSGEDASELASVTIGPAIESWVSSNKGGVAGAYTLLVEGDGELNDGQGDSAGLAELVLPIAYDARLV